MDFNPELRQMAETFDGFTIIKTNEMNKEQRQEHIVAARCNSFLVEGNGPPCFCKLRNNKCCTDDSCVNRKAGVACGPKSCGSHCSNNGWEKGTFVDDKLIVSQKGTSFGIFTTQLIVAQEILGEFTGIIKPGDTRMDHINRRMTLYIPQVNHIVDANEKGSRLRYLAQSHNSNCQAKVMINDGVYKIVIIAVQDIQHKSECTLDFSREYSSYADIPECHCGSHNCTGLVGWLTTPVPMLLPEKITDLATEGSACVQELLCSPLPHIEFNPCHVETHIHGALEPVAVIVQRNGNLRVTRGKILECFVNKNKCYVYKVRINDYGLVDMYLPILLVFKYVETAIFHLGLFEEEDKESVRGYLSKPQTRQNAEFLDNEMLQRYSQKFLSNQIPDFFLERRKYEGSAAIGLSDWILDTEHTTTHPGGPSTRTTRRRYRSCYKPTKSSPTVFMNDAQSFPAPVPQMKKLAAQSCVVQTNNFEYYLDNINNPPLKQIVKENNSIAVLERAIRHAAATVTHFMGARRPSTRPINYTETYDAVLRELMHYYVEVQDKSLRRFLIFPHYLMAIEVEARGSIHLNWCSLCGHEHTFNGKQTLEQHFHLYHMICATEFRCHNCNHRSSFPSDFMKHVENCTPKLVHLLLLDTCPYMMDGYSDFMALLTDEGYFRHILVPGLPKVECLDLLTEDDLETQQFILSTAHCLCPDEKLQVEDMQKPTSVSTRIIDMNPETKRPRDECVKVIDTKLKIAISHLYFDENDKLNHGRPPMYKQSLVTNVELLVPPKKSKTREKLPSQESSRETSTRCSRSASRVSFSCDEENLHGPSKFEFNRYGHVRKCCTDEIQDDEQDDEQDDLDNEFQDQEE